MSHNSPPLLFFLKTYNIAPNYFKVKGLAQHKIIRKYSKKKKVNSVDTTVLMSRINIYPQNSEGASISKK